MLIKHNKLALAGVLALGVIMSTAGFAAASTDNATPVTPKKASSVHEHLKLGTREKGPEFAQLLGLTPEQLREQLKTGRSLADVAKAQGKDLTSLQEQIVASMNARIDQLVKDGKLTTDQAAKIKGNTVQRANGLLKSSQAKRGFFLGVETQLPTILGIDATTLKQELQSGKSLVQIAEAKGMKQSDLVSQLQLVIEKNIDQAVTDKKLATEKANQLKKDLTQKLTDWVSKTHQIRQARPSKVKPHISSSLQS